MEVGFTLGFFALSAGLGAIAIGQQNAASRLRAKVAADTLARERDEQNFARYEALLESARAEVTSIAGDVVEAIEALGQPQPESGSPAAPPFEDGSAAGISPIQP